MSGWEKVTVLGITQLCLHAWRTFVTGEKVEGSEHQIQICVFFDMAKKILKPNSWAGHRKARLRDDTPPWHGNQLTYPASIRCPICLHHQLQRQVKAVAQESAMPVLKKYAYLGPPINTWLNQDPSHFPNPLQVTAPRFVLFFSPFLVQRGTF